MMLPVKYMRRADVELTMTSYDSWIARMTERAMLLRRPNDSESVCL